MARNGALITLASLVLIACSTKEKSAISHVESIITQSMRDPESAIFRNVRYVDTGRTQWVCGEINARNGFGGMTGFQNFVASSDATIIRFQDDPEFTVAFEFCDGTNEKT